MTSFQSGRFRSVSASPRPVGMLEVEAGELLGIANSSMDATRSVGAAVVVVEGPAVTELFCKSSFPVDVFVLWRDD